MHEYCVTQNDDNKYTSVLLLKLWSSYMYYLHYRTLAIINCGYYQFKPLILMKLYLKNEVKKISFFFEEVVKIQERLIMESSYNGERTMANHR